MNLRLIREISTGELFCGWSQTGAEPLFERFHDLSRPVIFSTIAIAEQSLKSNIICLEARGFKVEVIDFVSA